MRAPPDRNGRLRPVAIALAALLLSATAARAQQGEVPAAEADPLAAGSGPLEAKVEAQTLQVTQQPDGSELRRWRTATRLKAGEEVYYTVRVRNPGKAPVMNVVVTKRMPFGVAYLKGSATGPDCAVQFSLDGGVTFAPAAQPAASTKGKPARKGPGPEYTHLRWILSQPLAPGATALLRFRATFT